MEFFEIISSVCNFSNFTICAEYISDLLVRASLVFGAAAIPLIVIGAIISEFFRHNRELRNNIYEFFFNIGMYCLFTFFALIFVAIPILSAISEIIDFSILV